MLIKIDNTEAHLSLFALEFFECSISSICFRFVSPIFSGGLLPSKISRDDFLDLVINRGADSTTLD